VIEVFRLPELIAAARSGRSPVLECLGTVCATTGAFALTDLALPAGLLTRIRRATLDFFALPTAAKERLRPDAGDRYGGDQYVGWTGLTGNRNQYGFADHKEMFHIGPRVDASLRGPDQWGRLAAPAASGAWRGCPLWPAELPAMAESWHAYYREMQRVATELGLAFAAALGVAADRWLSLTADNWADLAANYYPAFSGQPAGVRNAVHSDLTMFTILYQDAGGGGGLRMRGRDGGWTDVPPVDGQVLVNVGELLTYLTSDRWWAVPHEVREATPDAPGADTARISIPFFYRPNDDRVIAPFQPSGSAVTRIPVGAWVRERKRLTRTS
jgi:isopenicillin N synthase-like dioxygenase